MLTSVIATQSERLLRLVVVADFAREPPNALQSRLRAAFVNACSCEGPFGVLHVRLDELLLLPRKIAQQDGGGFGLQEGDPKIETTPRVSSGLVVLIANKAQEALTRVTKEL